VSTKLPIQVIIFKYVCKIDLTAFLELSSNCGTCPSGRYLKSTGSCELCPTGRYSPSGSKDSCDLCPEGEYSAELGATFCWSCAANTSMPGSSSCDFYDCSDEGELLPFLSSHNFDA
jgi:hypothetical protein